MTAPLTRVRVARNIASGGIESSSLWREPPRSRGYFYARIPGVPSHGGAPDVGNAPGMSRTAGRDEPRCALARGRAP